MRTSALRPGEGSGIVVLDVDPRHGGDESLAELEREYGELPGTVEALTGGGGRHLLFSYPEGGTRTRAGVMPGLDIRSDGAFIVAPPSLHASGRDYGWELSSVPGEVPLAPIPSCLIDLAGRPSQNGERPDPVEIATIPEGGRNDRLTSLAGTMRRRGMGEEAILAALREENRARCKPPLDDREVRRIASSVARYEPEPSLSSPDPEDRRPECLVEIQVNGRWGGDLLDEAWSAIAEKNRPPRLFRHDVWSLACVKDGALQPVSKDEFLGKYVERSARWMKIERTQAGGLKRSLSNFPTRLLGALYATPLMTIPRIDRLIRIPAFVGEALELRDATGFQAGSGDYFHGASVGIEGVPDQPTAEDLKAGRELLHDWFREFGFANDASRAHAIALLITLLARHGIDGNTPLWLVEAAEAGTGKSCLVENILLAAHGEKTAPAGIARDEDEIRKQALSWVFGQESVICLDNLNAITGARSRILCALITAGGFRDRIMREHVVAGGAWHGVLIVTANNLDIDVEMIRRVVRIRLECPVENPWSREFSRIDLDAWTLCHRQQIVRAVAVAIQAWRCAGCPRGERIRPSFGAWSQIVGGVLRFVDPELAKTFLSEDDLAEAMAFGRGAEEFREFAVAWSDHAAAKRKVEYSAGELVQVGTASRSLPARVVENRQGQEPSERAKAMRMSKYLEQVRGKVVRVGDERRRVVARTGRANALVWSLKPVEEPT